MTIAVKGIVGVKFVPATTAKTYGVMLMMPPRSLNESVQVSVSRQLRIAAVGLSPREVEQLGQSLGYVGGGRLVAFDHPGRLTANIPAGNVDLVVLGGFAPPEISRKMLRWVRRRWSGCMCLIIGTNTADERIARENGAMFLLRPVTGDIWDGVLDGALQCQAAKLASA